MIVTVPLTDAIPRFRPALGVDSLLPPGACAVLALTVGGCRWPIGELDEPAFHFCNQPCLRRSYCAAHRRLAGRRTA